MEIIVSKFGGSSLADAESIRKVAKIVLANPSRKVIVLSAPGRRDKPSPVPNGTGQSLISDQNKSDPKITDLLFKRQFEPVFERFFQIAVGLDCQNSLKLITDLRQTISSVQNQEWVVSRGEWLMAQIFAEFIKGRFIDSTELIKINENRNVQESSYEKIAIELRDVSQITVIPGFYGADDQGRVLTLPRNGSDISGSVIARGLRARAYEVWTDVDGVMNTDPNKDKLAQFLPTLTYDEIYEMEVQVLHKDATLPVSEVGIATNIKNTFNPEHPGTWIVCSNPLAQEGDKRVYENFSNWQR